MKATKEPCLSLCRWIALFGIAFATLTRLDGSPVYIVPDMVTEVTGPIADLCSTQKGARALVRTLASFYCVRQSPEEARDILAKPPTARESK